MSCLGKQEVLKYFLFLLCFMFTGCFVREFGIIKIDEASNGKSVTIPQGYRLGVVLQAKWFKSVQDLQAPPGIKLLGIDHREKFVDRRITQFVVVTFAVKGSGDVIFRYEDKSFAVKVIQQ